MIAFSMHIWIKLIKNQCKNTHAAAKLQHGVAVAWAVFVRYFVITLLSVSRFAISSAHFHRFALRCTPSLIFAYDCKYVSVAFYESVWVCVCVRSRNSHVSPFFFFSCIFHHNLSSDGFSSFGFSNICFIIIINGNFYLVFALVFGCWLCKHSFSAIVHQRLRRLQR